MAVSGLGFRYPTRIKPALDDLSFTVAEGETMLVLGPSGSGKSTLTLCLDGLIPHVVEGERSGEVVLAGLVVGDNPVHRLAQEAGLVFQDPDAQFCTLTVEDEVAFGLENLCRPPDGIDPVIDAALYSVGLAGQRSRRLDSLSGGERQRVALASVLAMGPRVLVFDEPSANLDPKGTAELFALLRELSLDKRHTLVIIEHKLDEIIDWIDSVLVLDESGRCLFRGGPRTVFYDHAAELAAAGVWQPQTTELVRALRADGWPVTGRPLGAEETVAALDATPGLVARLRMSARASGDADRPDSEGAPVPPDSRGAWDRSDSTRTPRRPASVLRVDGLTFRYPSSFDDRPALADVDLAVEAGSLHAIVGANGAGKTTLASLMTGVLRPERGAVFLDGEDVARMSTRTVSDRVGYVFQNPEHQFVTDTVFGELAFSLSPRPGRRVAGHLTSEQHARVESWLGRLGLLDLAEANPYTISQGQKRRLSVAAMAIRGQSVLILDEPTLGQDQRQADLMVAMLRELRAAGHTVIVITHDMRLVSEHADFLTALHRGRSIFAGTPAEFFALPDRVREAGLDVPVLARIGSALGLTSDSGGHGGEPLLSAAAFLGAAGSADAGADAASAGSQG